MTAAAVSYAVRARLGEAHTILNRLIPALDLTPELTPTDPTTLKDTEVLVERVRRIDQLSKRRTK